MNNEYLIKKETLVATASVMRECIYSGKINYTFIPSIDAGDGKVVENSVTISYRKLVDDAGQDGLYDPSGDTVVAYDFLENNEGQVVPVLYDTFLEAYPDEPDIYEPFFYEGTEEINGQVYDKWRKIELGDSDNGYTDNGEYGWDTEAKQYIYTNVIVNQGEIDPVDFPGKVYEVHEAGYNKGFNEAKIEYGDMLIQTISGSGTILDLTKIDNLTIIRAYAFCQHVNLTKVFLPKEISSIGENAFYNCSNLNTVFYMGTLQEWEDNVTVGSGNEKLLSAISFYSETNKGNDGVSYWHYVDGVPTFWSSVSRGLVYTLLDNGTYSITGRGTCTDTDLVIPETYRNIPVTRIEENAFSGYSSLKTIDIPDSVTTIGQYAFQSSGLTTIKLPSNITSISAYTFFRCSSLTSVYIPRGVTSIGISAFFECNNLTNVYYFGSSDEWYDIDIATNAPLTSATRHYGVVAYEQCMYQINDDWTEYEVIGLNYDYDGYIIEGGATFEYLTMAATIDNLPVTSIAESAFEENSYIYHVIIGNSITHIGDCAFYGSPTLYSITIPISVQSIGYDVFSDSLQQVEYEGNAIQWYDISHSNDPWAYSFNVIFLDSLPEYTDEQGITYTSSNDNTYYVCSSAENVSEPNVTIAGYISGVPVKEIDDFAFGHYAVHDIVETIIIPNTVTTIGVGAFTGNTEWGDPGMVTSTLREVYIPDGVTHIKEGAFYACTNITNITIPNTVTTIDAQAFGGCLNLVKITFGNNLHHLGDNVFENCLSLQNITIPNSVISIGDYAFWGCENLTSITIPDSVMSIGNDAFTKPNEIHVSSLDFWLNVCAGSVEFGDETFIYINDEVLTSLLIPNTITTIPNYAFAGYKNLYSVEFEEFSNCTIIGENAFCNCDNLSYVFIPTSITSIGDHAFARCPYLNINFEEREGEFSQLRSIGKYAFEESGADNTINLPYGLTRINDYAFYQSLYSEIEIPNTVTSIGEYAFAKSNIYLINLPNDITEISHSAFEGCAYLGYIDLPENLEIIGYSSFRDIGAYHFASSEEEEISIVIPANVRIIRGDAFGDSEMNESLIYKLIFKGTPSTIDSDAAAGVSYVYVPWSEGEVANAPWGANEVIYNYSE